MVGEWGAGICTREDFNCEWKEDRWLDGAHIPRGHHIRKGPF